MAYGILLCVLNSTFSILFTIPLNFITMKDVSVYLLKQKQLCYGSLENATLNQTKKGCSSSIYISIYRMSDFQVNHRRNVFSHSNFIY